MRVYAISDTGKIRPINEDSFYLPREGERFCAVADGMGGHNAGEVASALAVEAFADAMRESGWPSRQAIYAAVCRANEAVFAESERDDEKSGMGTTFTALSEVDGSVNIAHVGDSRAYRIRNGTIMRLTTDHTLVEEMVAHGLITAREARVHPKRNYITRALGTTRRVEVDMIELNLHAGDVFLLCTDGLSNHVEEREMLEATLSDADWNAKLERLVNAALSAGGPDNITAMYVIFEEANP